MTDTVTISRQCAEYHWRHVEYRPDDEDYRKMRDELCNAIASPASPSGLRKALEFYADPINWTRVDNPEPVWSARPSIYAPIETDGGERARRALASSSEPASAKVGDGWVKVDEEHPLPDDLNIGDGIEITTKAGTARLTIDDITTTTFGRNYWAAGRMWRYESMSAYRRRLSAEQGG